MRFNKVIAIIRRKYGEISGFVEFTRNIYTTQGENKSKMCYFTLPFLGDPSLYILSQAVAIETRNLSQFDGHFKLISQHTDHRDSIQ